jgi:Fe-S-cluster containining protein
MLLPEHGDVIEGYDHEWVTLPEGRGAVVKKGADGNCIYLGPDGCTIHDRAPAICRIFDCRRWFLSKTRNERRALVKSGMADADVFEAGRKRLHMAGTVIRLNPNIAEAFTGGMPEVSVFWEEEVDGEIVRQKARFDYLKVRAISDLKTHDPMDGTSFEASCHRVLKTRAHAIQAQSYLQARSKLAEFVADGAVYGDHDAEWLRKVAASPECAFVFCFWASKGPPLTWGGYFSPGNRKLEEAQVDIDRALQRYVDFRREFGEDCAWIRPAPLTEIDPDNVDNWWLLNAA